MTKARLFDDRARQRRWTGSRALVPLPRDRCPDCHGPTQHRGIVEVPLFAHGGYGAARSSMQRWCPCGWIGVTDVIEVSPRPYRSQESPA